MRDRADHHQQVGLARREARQRGAEAVGVVGRGADRHELHRAAGGDERVGEERELARPADQLVLARRQVLEGRRPCRAAAGTMGIGACVTSHGSLRHRLEQPRLVDVEQDQHQQER